MKREIITIDEYGRLSMPTVTAHIWMSEPELVELFCVSAPTIRAKIKAIYKDGAIQEYIVKQSLRQENGNELEVYSLEMVVALAFRIHAHSAAKLRKYILRTLGTVSKPTAINILLTCPRKADGHGNEQFFN